jgi:hypothetical protein
MPKILRGILLNIFGSNIPAGIQINAKRIETPARVIATG